MRQLILLLIFLFWAPITLGVSIFALTSFSGEESIKSSPSVSLLAAPSQNHLYAALPQKTGEVLGAVVAADARPIIIEGYLKKFRSPLAPYSGTILAAAERYNVDYQLMVAIAQCESNLCRKSPIGSFNCWGFENGETRFLSWEQAIFQVAKTLREKYLDFGLTTPELIMPKYAPPSVAKGGPWARCVNQFIANLESGDID